MNQQTLPLEDIILPTAVGLWPLAWGWWLLIVISIAAVIGLILWLIKRVKLQRKIQQAEKHLISSTQTLSDHQLYSAINTWLKVQAQETYPFAKSLHGDAWIEFLNSSAGKAIFTDQQAQALSQGLYQKETVQCDTNELLKNAQLWLKLSKALEGGRL